MKTRTWLALMLVVCLSSIALTHWLMKNRQSPAPDASMVDNAAQAPALIKSSPPIFHDFAVRIPWIGKTESRSAVTLTAPLDGLIESIQAKDETLVEKGTVLVQLGGPLIQDQREALLNEVASLAEEASLATENLSLLQKSLKAHLATKEQVTAAQSDQVRIQANYQRSQQTLKTLDSQSVILAPLTGVFTNRLVQERQRVHLGQRIGDIVDIQHLRIVASLYPPEHARLIGKSATVSRGNTRVLSATVTSVLPNASPSGALMVWIEGPQIDQRLHPGETVAGELTLDTTPGALAVPMSAIVYNASEQPILFVQNKNDYVPRQVHIGHTDGQWAEVLDGLDENESVVTQGAYELFHRRFNEEFKVED